MTKFEEIGVEIQEEAFSKRVATSAFRHSCELCCLRGIHIDCEHCAIAGAHYAAMERLALMEYLKRKELEMSRSLKITLTVL